MKTLEKIILISAVLFVSLVIGTTLSNAATETVGNEQDLTTAITNANNGDTIELSNDIVLTKPLEINGKTITIIGNGHTITRNENNWTPNGSNGSLITAGGDGTKLTLASVNLTNAHKYGIQSFNGAYVAVDSVNISNCGFGGVIVNAGTLEIKNLALGKNGNPSNNGIEIAKGSGVIGNNSPVLIMNGTLTSTQNENVIYLAENDSLITFEVRNTDTTTNKIYVQGRKVVVTDSNNTIIYESNENKNIVVVGTEFTEKKEPDINDIEKTEPEQEKEEEPKRTNPKTGVENYIGIAVIALLVTMFGIAYCGKKRL